MRINHNVMAMNTHRQLGLNTAAGSKSVEKLSSGFRINRAGDDAAGLAISEKMRAQIRGLNQASRNSQDSISLIQTAEGAVNESHAILQRMRELAVQSANDTNVTVDREQIQQEMNQLTTEVNRIGNTTEFNTKKLLNGELSSTFTVDAAAYTSVATGNGLSIVQDTGDIASGSYTLEINQVSLVSASSTDAVQVAVGLVVNGDWDATFDAGIALDWTATENNALRENVTDVSGVTGASLTIEMISSASITVTMAGGYAGIVTEDVQAAADGSFTFDSSGVSFVISDLGDTAVNDTLVYTIEDANDTAVLVGTESTLWTTNPATAAVTLSASVTTGAEAGTWTGTFVDAATLTMVFDGDDGTEFSATVTLTAGTSVNFEAIGYEFNIVAPTDEDDWVGGIFEYSIDATYSLTAGVVDSGGTTLTTDTLISGWDGDTSGTANLTLTGSVTGLDLTVTGDIGVGVIEFEIEAEHESTTTDGSLKFQVGANQSQSMGLVIEDMRADALDISSTTAGAATSGDAADYSAVYTSTMEVTDGTSSTNSEYALDVSTHENAAAAVTVINDAIEGISSQRSKLGAVQNRLEYTIKNLDTSAENLQAAESRIRDVDMAKEMMEFTKNNILQQAAQSMLAQANQAPQGVLQLLR